PPPSSGGGVRDRAGRGREPERSAASAGESSSSSALRRASSGEAPPEVSSAYRSSRCCAISSTMEASRAGSSFSSASRSRISCDQSGTLRLRDPAHRLDERDPRALLQAKDLTALGRDLVVAPPALRGLLDPATLDQAARLQAIEERIEGRHVEAQRPARTRLDELPDLVAVAGAPLHQGQDEELGRTLLELPVHPHMLHCDILLSHWYTQAKGLGYSESIIPLPAAGEGKREGPTFVRIDPREDA